MPQADLVMVFPYKCNPLVRWGEALEPGLRPATDSERHRMEAWDIKRQVTVTSMSEAGLMVVLFYSLDHHEILLRIAASEQHLRQVAEATKTKLELKPQYLSAFAEFKNDYGGRRELNYGDRRVVSHLFKVHADSPSDVEDLEGGSDKYGAPAALLRTTDRIKLMDHIIRSSDHDCAGIDIGQLMHDEEMLTYFPLHENRKLRELDRDWFRAFCWGSNVDKVRDYFGERIAMYFLFLAHLHRWLVLPAFIGFFLWIGDLFRGTPDNASELPLCFFMSLWAMLFGHFWRRTAATYALRWGTYGMSRQAEPARPEFVGISRVNPVTGRIDRYYPWNERIWKVMFSWAVLSVAAIMLVFVVVLLFALRHMTDGRAAFQVLNATIVEFMNGFFTHLAVRLTNRENHREQSAYTSHLLAKTVIFKTINCYVSLYYIAFFKEHAEVYGLAMRCANDDCLADLGSQLGIFMIMRVGLQNFMEIGIPCIDMWYRDMTEGHNFHRSIFTNLATVDPQMSRAERERKKDAYDLCEDMDEVLILYGYTTLFVVACPWVPLLALLTSVVDCFLGQKKLVMLYRRPFPLPAANNEPWDAAFDIVGTMAVVTNTALVVFASNSMEDWSNSSRVILFVVLENFVLLCRYLVGLALPAVPYSVQLLKKQQDVIVRRQIDLAGEDDSEMRAAALRTNEPPPIYSKDESKDDEDVE